MSRDRFYDRIESVALTVIVFAVLAMAAVWLSGCTKAPPTLSPDAKAAFHATRVVQVLDVLRDAAIAANEVVPPLLTTNATRTVVLWHRTAILTVQAVPSGWQATVKAGLFTLTCHPLAAPSQPPPPCTPQLSPSEVAHLTPYVGLALVVINEVP